MKNSLKKIVLRTPLLRNIFRLIYRWGGCRPWSTGYSVYKYGYIKDIVENHLDYFQAGQLPELYGSGLDERAVEYPWVFSRIKASELKILDAGSSLNHKDILAVKPLQLRQLTISNLTKEDFPDAQRRPSYVIEDVRDMCYKDESFDAVICISTLEHIGMDNAMVYSSDVDRDKNNKYAYLTAINEMKRTLKKSGTLYITVPYGEYKNHRWFQVFDREMVIGLKEKFDPSRITETYFKYKHPQWHFSDAKECATGYYFDIHADTQGNANHLAAAQCVVCLELVK